MFTALDKYNRKVSIDEATEDEPYFCEYCKEQLIIKKGDIRAHHFAHKGTCTDNWHYDMSDWHKEWQNLFPVESREVVMESNGEKHRADVFINNIVIEFQHSPLSNDEFNERNNFYTSLGFNVVWVFDVQEPYSEEKIYKLKGHNNNYGWKYAIHTLDGYNPNINIKVKVYFQYSSEECEADKKEHPCLFKLTWVSPDFGLKRFSIYEKVYYDFEIEEFKTDIKAPTYSRVFNDMFNDHFKKTYDHGYMFEGCPLSASGYAVTDIDYSGREHGKCRECKYCYDYFKCAYPEALLNIPSDAKNIKIYRDTNKFVESVSFTDCLGNTITKSITKSQPGVGTIIDLWFKNELQNFGIFRDIKNDMYAKITMNPNEQLSKYGKIYALFSRDRYRFPPRCTRELSKPLAFYNEARWVLTYPLGNDKKH